MIGLLFEGQAWCSGESCLTELPGRGFEAASPQILRGKGLSRFIPSPDPTHVGASGTGSAPFLLGCWRVAVYYVKRLHFWYYRFSPIMGMITAFCIW